MFARCGDGATAEGTKRVEALAADGDLAGVAVWLRIIDAMAARYDDIAGAGALDSSSRGRGRVAPDDVRPRGFWPAPCGSSPLASLLSEASPSVVNAPISGA